MKRLNRDEMAQWLADAAPGLPVYLVGIGGCGMSGLANLLLDLNFTVFGSDLQENNEVIHLRKRGAKIFIGHAPTQLINSKPGLVIYSSAIRADNPELAAAEQSQIAIARRAILLAAITQERKNICIAGMHGKSTTAALLTHSLAELGAKPGFAIGAMSPQLGSHAATGKVDSFFVVETDESDGTLCEFQPHQSIVLNIDEEHLDFYENFEAVCDDFTVFAAQTKGAFFYCADDSRLAELYSDRIDAITFGINASAKYRAELLRGQVFNVWRGDALLGEFQIRLFGEKNISNALAAIALLHYNGFAPDEIAEAVGSFRGVERRQQKIFCNERHRIFDDYGHHPREITATLQAIKEQCDGRLLVAFQPHRYSRTQHLLSEFAESFGEADLLWVTEVYAASETPIADVNGQRLAAAISNQGQPAEYAASLSGLLDAMKTTMQSGDVVVFIGAGNITRAAHQLAVDLGNE